MFIQKYDRWAAVDILIRGVSLSAHYRRKFDSTYFEKGLDGLVAQLEMEVNEEFDEMEYHPDTTLLSGLNRYDKR